MSDLWKRGLSLLPAMIEPVLAVALGLGLGLLAMALAGEPHAAEFLWNGAFGSLSNLGMTLFYMVPLVFTGLSVAVAFRAGLFNVGAQGQLLAGCLAAAAVGSQWPLPAPLSWMVAGLAAFGAGALWGAVPGWLKVRTGSHEVITTIMLNFIAAGMASYVTLYILKNPDSQNPETREILSSYIIPALQWNGLSLFDASQVTWALPLALFTAFLVWLLVERTLPGFRLRALGENERAAQAAGISVGATRVAVMALAGGLAGLVALGEVLGSAHRFRLGIADFGFTGVAVALLGRCHPAGVVAAAGLFAALHNGSMGLEFESDVVTQEVSLLLRGLVILAVSAEGLWYFVRKWRISKGTTGQ